MFVNVSDAHEKESTTSPFVLFLKPIFMKQLYKILILLILVLFGNILFAKTTKNPVLLEDALLLPNATISSNTTSICVGGTSPVVTFTGSNGTAPYTFVYTINGNQQPALTTDTGDSISVTVPTTVVGVFNYQLVSVTDSSGTQTETGSVTVNVIDNYTIDFINDANANTCSGEGVLFTPQISNGVAPYTYLWNFGNGFTSVEANPVFEFTSTGCATGTFNVQLTVTDSNGCSDTVNHSITVKQEPAISLEDTDLFSPFSNCSSSPTPTDPNYTLTLNNSSTSTACLIDYSIDWGDGTIQNNFTASSFPLTHTYTELGSFNLVFSANGTNGCVAEVNYIVANQTNPAGSLGTLGSTTGLCAPAVVPFTITNWELNSPGTTYLLDFGDGESVTLSHPLTSNIINHTYLSSSCPSQSFTGTLTVTNACESTPYTAGNIQVRVMPSPSFSNPPVACETDNVCFTNNTSVGSTGANCATTAIYTWNFGDPTSPNNILVTNSAQPQSACHIFSGPGNYNVTLSVTNPCGTDTFTNGICIEPPLTPQFSTNTSSGCAPLAVTATNTTDISEACQAPTYLWTVAYAAGNCGTTSGYTFTNGTNSASANPSISFTNSGIYTLTLTTTNSCGSFSTAQVINVKLPPTASINTIAAVCGPSTINPTAVVNTCAPTSEVLTYAWSFLGGSPSTANTAVPGAIVYNTPGDYTIELTVTNGCGTSVTATETFTVNTVPVITNTNLEETICSGVPTTAVSLTASVPGTTFSWTTVASAGITGFIASGATAIIPSQNITTTSPTSGTVTYTITPTLNGCVGTPVVYVITVNPAPVITSQPLSSSICEGGVLANLSVTHINGGGVPTYQWYSNTINSTTGATLLIGATNANFTPPSATVGITYYFVIITFSSGGGCSSITSDMATIEISEGTIITTQPMVTQNLCVGVTLQDPLAVAYSGGAGTPSYQWYSNTTNSNTGGTLIAGATSATYTPTVFTTVGIYYYYVVITSSGNGCGPVSSDTATIVVVDDPIITTQPLVAQTLCEGITPTDLTVVVTGGSGVFSYQWFSNTANNTTTGTLIPGATMVTFTPPVTTAGTFYYYLVINQSVVGCSVTSATAEVIVNPSPSLTSQPASSTICLGQTPALLSVSYANGVGTPTFQWFSNTVMNTVGATLIAGATNATYVPPSASVGTLYYFVVLTFPTGGCSAVTSNIATITINQHPVISNATAIICSGGTFSVIPDTTSGDVVPVGTTYTWSVSVINPTGTITGASAVTTPQTAISQTLINTTISPSTVTYMVTPIAGICFGTPFTVTVTVNPSVNANVVLNNSTCFGADDATIQINITGGIPFNTGAPYLVSWTGPNGFTSSTTNLSNLEPGVYNLAITDQGGCPFSDSFTITEPADINITTNTETDIDCFGNANGAISISVSGGTGAYSYTWTKDTLPFASTEDLTNLVPGVYEVTVSDANNCGPKTATFTITEPPVLTLSLASQTDVICFGASTGAITVSAVGGTPNYNFAWTGPNGFTSATQDLNNLQVGVYNLLLTDGANCSQNLSVTISQPTEIIISAVTTAIECYGDNSASITVTVTGGNAPYQIGWSNLGMGFFQDNLSAGDYTITITDASNCVKILTVNIPEAPIFDVNPVVAQISCFGANDGSINLNFVGGIAPVTLVWSDGSTAGTTRNNLGPGTYTVTITDSKPCVINETFIIVEPQALVLSANIINAFDCDDANSGSINLLVSGGTAPFTSTWSNGAVIEDLINIPAGNYQVTVTDARGCVQTATYVVNRQPPIVITIDTQTIADCEALDIKQVFEAQVSGGIPPYQLNWSSGTVSGANNELMETNQSGAVLLEVTDSLGCTANYSFNVDVPNIGATSFTQDSFAFNAFGTYSINDPIQFTNTSTGDYESLVWNFGDGILSSEENPIHIYTGEGSYVVTLTVVYSFGCSYVHTITLLIDKGYKMMMPNGFTPNGDNINDTFTPVFLGMTSIEMSIYDTWGEMIYFEKGESIRGWDGQIKGRDAENGNYFFKVIAIPFYGGEVQQDGPFTLIK